VAEITIIGQKEPLIVSEQVAITLQEDWLAKRLPEVIEINGIMFKKDQLKAIRASKQTEQEDPRSRSFPRDFTTDELKEVIGDLEEKFKEYAELYPGITDKYNSVYHRGELQLMIELEAMVLTDAGTLHTYKGYSHYTRRKDALRELRRRRAYAKQKEQESIDTQSELE